MSESEPQTYACLRNTMMLTLYPYIAALSFSLILLSGDRTRADANRKFQIDHEVLNVRVRDCACMRVRCCSRVRDVNTNGCL